MNQKYDRLYPKAPLEKDDLEQILEKKMKDFNIFNNHINNIKKTITMFKDKNHKQKRKMKIIKL